MKRRRKSQIIVSILLLFLSFFFSLEPNRRAGVRPVLFPVVPHHVWFRPLLFGFSFWVVLRSWFVQRHDEIPPTVFLPPLHRPQVLISTKGKKKEKKKRQMEGALSVLLLIQSLNQFHLEHTATNTKILFNSGERQWRGTSLRPYNSNSFGLFFRSRKLIYIGRSRRKMKILYRQREKKEKKNGRCENRLCFTVSRICYMGAI